MCYESIASPAEVIALVRISSADRRSPSLRVCAGNTACLCSHDGALPNASLDRGRCGPLAAHRRPRLCRYAYGHSLAVRCQGCYTLSPIQVQEGTVVCPRWQASRARRHLSAVCPLGRVRGSREANASSPAARLCLLWHANAAPPAPTAVHTTAPLLTTTPRPAECAMATRSSVLPQMHRSQLARMARVPQSATPAVASLVHPIIVVRRGSLTAIFRSQLNRNCFQSMQRIPRTPRM